MIGLITKVAPIFFKKMKIIWLIPIVILFIAQTLRLYQLGWRADAFEREVARQKIYIETLSARLFMQNRAVDAWKNAAQKAEENKRLALVQSRKTKQKLDRVSARIIAAPQEKQAPTPKWLLDDWGEL